MLDDARLGRQPDQHPRVVNVEVPAIAGDVPVELVERLEKADLPRRAVGDLVAVLRIVQEHVLVADLDARAVAQGLEHIGLGPAVAHDAQHVEADDHPLAVPVGIGRGEVTVNAVADLVSLGVDDDRLAHVERGIGIDRHLA